MKTKEIANSYGIDQAKFERYLRSIKSPDVKEGLMSMSVENDIDGHVARFKEYLQQETAKAEAEAKAKADAAEKARIAAEEKQHALANMLITSGFSFDGYKIKKYSGYISGDDAISIDRGTSGVFSSATNVSASLTDSLVKIRRQAIKELKEAAYDLGCNAVIGVDFDYITLEPETANSSGGTTYLPYVFCVTANGNAVIIEKDE